MYVPMWLFWALYFLVWLSLGLSLHAWFRSSRAVRHMRRARANFELALASDNEDPT